MGCPSPTAVDAICTLSRAPDVDSATSDRPNPGDLSKRKTGWDLWCLKYKELLRACGLQWELLFQMVGFKFFRQGNTGVSRLDQYCVPLLMMMTIIIIIIILILILILITIIIMAYTTGFPHWLFICWNRSYWCTWYKSEVSWLWRWLYCLGGRNVSHQQQSFSRLPSRGRSR